MRRLFGRKRDKEPKEVPREEHRDLDAHLNDQNARRKGVVFAEAPSDPSVAFPSISAPAPVPAPYISATAPPVLSSESSDAHSDFAPRAASPLSLHSVNSSAHQSLARLAMSSTARVSSQAPSISQIVQPVTWSEMADEDLVGNLGGRERTRQEVLWEMVGSEERYVEELKSFKACYVDPLLSPSTVASPSSPASAALPLVPPSVTHPSSKQNPSPSSEDLDSLPIAARFMYGDRRSSFITRDPDSKDAHSNSDLSCTPHLPEIQLENATVYPSATNNSNNSRLSATFIGKHPSNSQQSLQPSKSNSEDQHVELSKSNGGTRPASPNTVRTSQSHSNSRNPPNKDKENLRNYLKFSSSHPPPPKKLHKPRTTPWHPSSSSAISSSDNTTVLLPESLKIVLQTIGEDLLSGHSTLCMRLKDRYYEQYPLVRSLTDVWADQDWIVKHYATYVLHLERALEDVEYALSLTKPGSSRNRDKRRDIREERKFTRLILKLEELASLEGESCLVICLTKPLMRLLKYPLLFQSLLYYSDAASPEFESTKAMAVEIDSIVKSIESEKISEEERQKMRDVWSRIDGTMEKELMVPRSERTLISEEMLMNSNADSRRAFSDVNRSSTPTLPPDTFKGHGPFLLRSGVGTTGGGSGTTREARTQKSFRRLSDLVTVDKPSSSATPPTLGSKRDIWLIKFSDVVLRCQRTGVTSLPMGLVNSSTLADKAVSSKDLNRKKIAFPATTGSVASSRQPRNLYRFIKIEEWVTSPQSLPNPNSHQHKNQHNNHQHDHHHDQKHDQKHDPVSLSSSTNSITVDSVNSVRPGTPTSTDHPSLSNNHRPSSSNNGNNNINNSNSNINKNNAEDGGPSRMSFSYQSDDLKPTFSNISREISDTNSSQGGMTTTTTIDNNGGHNSSNNNNITTVSPRMGEVIAKEGNAVAKFSNRLRPRSIEVNKLERALSPNGGGTRSRPRFDEPTAASLARVTVVSSRHNNPSSSLVSATINTRPSSRLAAPSSTSSHQHSYHQQHQPQQQQRLRGRVSSADSLHSKSRDNASPGIAWTSEQRPLSVTPTPLPRWI